MLLVKITLFKKLCSVAGSNTISCFEGYGMTQLQRLRARISCVSVEIRFFCLFLLLGSLLGALCEKLHNGTQFSALYDSDSIFRSWLRTAAFPLLLAVPLMLKNKIFYYLLFFCKGALIAYAICAIVGAGTSSRLSLLGALFLESVLPLPFFLLIASVWSGQIVDPRPSIWLLLPACFLPLIGILLKVLLL